MQPFGFPRNKTRTTFPSHPLFSSPQFPSYTYSHIPPIPYSAPAISLFSPRPPKPFPSPPLPLPSYSPFPIPSLPFPSCTSPLLSPSPPPPPILHSPLYESSRQLRIHGLSLSLLPRFIGPDLCRLTFILRPRLLPFIGPCAFFPASLRPPPLSLFLSFFPLSLFLFLLPLTRCPLVHYSLSMYREKEEERKKTRKEKNS